MATAPWPWWHQYTGSKEYRIRELLRAVLDLHGYFDDRETWLWRGQANQNFRLSPGVHTRIAGSDLVLDDDAVVRVTRALLDSTRNARLDVHEGAALPDLALLAQLQHHGAATPLLDVSLDPLVALYMAVVSPNGSDDDEDGTLFAIRKPKPGDTVRIQPFDTRSFEDIYSSIPSSSTVLYTAPDVSDRLRIQRGHFLLSRVSDVTPKVTIHASIDTGPVTESWITRRMNARSAPGSIKATTDTAVFRVNSVFKPALRAWLEERTGLTADFVYPTVWHQPHQEAFARSHGRRSRTS
jgi:hypothetical protein